MSRSRELHTVRKLGVAWAATGVIALFLPTAAAAFPQLRSPVPPGQTWVVCQGYNAFDHAGDDRYGLDLSADVASAGPAGCQGDAQATAGREVLAPASGTVGSSNAGSVCLNLDDGDSVLLRNLDGPPAGTRITGGAVMGTVRAPAQGYARLRLAAHRGVGCAGGSQVPFTEALGTRLACAQDLPASDLPNAWAGVRIEACAQPGAFHADFDGDLRDDVGVFQGYPGAQTKLWIMRSLGGGRFAAPAVAWDSGPGSWEWTRIKAVAGDFDGDGLTDVGAFYAYDNVHTQLWILRSIRGGFAPPALVWDSKPAAWDWARTKPIVGDFNFDEKTDIAALVGHDGAQAKLWIFSAIGSGRLGAPALVWDSGPGTWDWSRSKPVGSDVDGDERDDVAVFYGEDGAQTKLWTLRSLPTGGFAAPMLAWDSGPGAWDGSRMKPVAGDFNGDGRNDVGAFYGDDGAQTKLWTFAAAGAGRVAPSVAWDSGAGLWDWARTRAVAGDFDGDEIDDVGAFYDTDGAQTQLRTFLGSSSGFAAPTLAWDSGPGLWDWAHSLPL